MRLRHILPACVLATAATPALAEVSDKIPSVAGQWMWAAGFTFLALLLALRRPAAGLAMVPLALFWAWAGHDMLSDPFVGPAILRERGEGYIRAVYASGAAAVVGALLAPALVMLLGLRTRPVA